MLPPQDEWWTNTNHRDSMKLDQSDRLLLPNMPAKKKCEVFSSILLPPPLRVDANHHHPSLEILDASLVLLRFQVHKIMTLSYELQFNKGVGTRKLVATKSNNISFYILNTKTCFALRPIYTGWKRKQKRKFSLTFVVYWFYLFACHLPKWIV